MKSRKLTPVVAFQQALGGPASFSHEAKQTARRLAGVVGQHFKMPPGGKPLAPLPFVDDGHRKTKVGGNLFQGNFVSAPPVFEGGRKTFADVALEF